MIGQIGWFQCAQDIFGLSRLSGSSMSNYQILPRLYGGLVCHDAVFWYTYAEQTGTDSTQTTDYHRVFRWLSYTAITAFVSVIFCLLFKFGFSFALLRMNAQVVP
jgi:hypothetical protein